MGVWDEEFPDDEMMGGKVKVGADAKVAHSKEPEVLSKTVTPSRPSPVPVTPEKTEMANIQKERTESQGSNKIVSSDDLVKGHEARLGKEMEQLLKDIRRIGEEGKPQVAFGELFDDPQVEQFYEALVGTLKSAKKRGLIDFKGQMLLKGIHDSVIISIKE